MAGIDDFLVSNPSALPTRAPTAFELDQLALIGAIWADQEDHPNAPGIPPGDEHYYWLSSQPNDVRNTINALLAWARNQILSGGSGSTPVSDAYAAWVVEQPPGAQTGIADWIGAVATIGGDLNLWFLPYPTHAVLVNPLGSDVNFPLADFANAGLQRPLTEVLFTNATEWDHTHNRDTYPTVTCVDTGGRELIGGNPDYVTRNRVVVRFNSAVSGTMRIS